MAKGPSLSDELNAREECLKGSVFIVIRAVEERCAYDNEVEGAPRMTPQEGSRNERAGDTAQRERSVQQALPDVRPPHAARPGIPRCVGQAGAIAEDHIGC